MISGPVLGFLHKSQMECDIKKIKAVKVKEYNFFEQYNSVTALSSEINVVRTFNDVQVGDLYEVKILKIMKNPLQLIVEFAENVTGIIDALHFSDHGEVRQIPKSSFLSRFHG